MQHSPSSSLVRSFSAKTQKQSEEPTRFKLSNKGSEMHRKAFRSLLTASNFLGWIINELQPQACGLTSDLKLGSCSPSSAATEEAIPCH